MILLIDNYDSFSYNLYQLVGSLEPDIRVIRNDAMTVSEIEELKPDGIIISPGPGRPEDSGVCPEVIKKLGGKLPILGVCLGHQVICMTYGATVSYAKELMHGKQSDTTLDTDCELFKGCPKVTPVARYHSLAAVESTMPECLEVTARTADGEIMAVKHRDYPVYGVQFHPESIMAPEGKRMLANFITMSKNKEAKSSPRMSSDFCFAKTRRINTMIKEAIVKIVQKGDLTYDEAYQVMNEIMSGETTQTQNAAFLAALSTKSTKAETIEEISGCAAAMREHAIKVEHEGDVLEIVGTGGDGAHSFNISTTAAMVIAAAGVKVAKHGNRAASSKSGTADCLEALGVNINLEPEQCRKLLDTVGICFLFAQKYHTSMKYVGAIRKELGIRTVFNILGPLTNPAHPTFQVLGVYDESLVEPLAQVLMELGVKKGVVVYGMDKLDEISISAPTKVCDFENGRYRTYTINPEDFGFKTADKSEIVGGTPQENAEITIGILGGSIKGAKREIVQLNAGAGLFVAGKTTTLAEGVKLAGEIIDSGAALDKLNELKKASQEV